MTKPEVHLSRITEQTTLGELAVQRAILGVSTLTMMRDINGKLTAVCQSTSGLHIGQGDTEAAAIDHAFALLIGSIAERFFRHGEEFVIEIVSNLLGEYAETGFGPSDGCDHWRGVVRAVYVGNRGVSLIIEIDGIDACGELVDVPMGSGVRILRRCDRHISLVEWELLGRDGETQPSFECTRWMTVSTLRRHVDGDHK